MSPMREDTFYLRTFGCQMNAHDSERIAGMLEKMGMSRCGAPEQAAVLVFNTCSIREKADSRLAGHLGHIARLKEAEPARTVVLAGCLPQSRREELARVYPFVDVLVGPQSLHELPRLLEERADKGTVATHFQEVTTRWSADLPRSRVEGPCAWVQITAGCTNLCSYCIVPHVRGPEASRPASEIVSEVESLVAGGVMEVTLLGQNVNAYGKEPSFGGTETFVDLLRSVCGIGGLERLRFMTSHPKDVSMGLIDLISRENQVCEHVHLPVQAGSDRILTAMKRGYDRRSYVSLVHQLREAVPELALTTDIIVGFPGETEEDFAQTMALVEECSFDAAYTFVYSPRPGTAASSLPGRVRADVARERMERLVDTIQSGAARKNAALVGCIVEVLVERASRQGGGEVMGRTRTHKPVNFKSEKGPGVMARVEVTEASSTSLRGREVA